MATKPRDYICHVPKGEHRKGCGGNAKVRELVKREVKKAVSDMAKQHEKKLAAHKKEVAKRIKAAKKK